jgi:hypothetical protein
MMIGSLTANTSFWELTRTNVLPGLALFVVTFVGSAVLVCFLLVRLPADYFTGALAWGAPGGHPAWRWATRIAKNLLGVLLVLLGVVLSLPGFPGQGLLTIAVGVMLLDFPGKRRLARWLLGSPKVLAPVNRLRRRSGKPPLVLDRAENPSAPPEKAAVA